MVEFRSARALVLAAKEQKWQIRLKNNILTAYKAHKKMARATVGFNQSISEFVRFVDLRSAQ